MKQTKPMRSLMLALVAIFLFGFLLSWSITANRTVGAAEIPGNIKALIKQLDEVTGLINGLLEMDEISDDTFFRWLGRQSDLEGNVVREIGRKIGELPDKNRKTVLKEVRRRIGGRMVSAGDTIKPVGKILDESVENTQRLLKAAKLAALEGEATVKAARAAQEAADAAKDARKVGKCAKAFKVVKVGFKVVGVVGAIYEAGNFAYNFYTYDYDDSAFRKLTYCGNKATEIPFTPEFGLTEWIFDPNHATKTSINRLMANINKIGECHSEYNKSGSCTYTWKTIFGQERIEKINTKQKMNTLLKDQKYYEDLVEQRFEELTNKECSATLRQ